MFTFRPWSKYHQLPGGDGESDICDSHDDEKSLSVEVAALPLRVGRKHSWYWHVGRGLLILLPSLLLSALAFTLGRYSDWPARPDSNPVNGVGTEWTAFNYNATFSRAPSPESNAAWGSMFPPHNGFFHDAGIAPHGASLSVFHQLHCLDGLRHAFYIMYAAAQRGEPVDDAGLPDPLALHHTRHCIDFLRQKIMCNADLGIEWVGPAHNGTVAFGIDQKCSRWRDIYAWVVDVQERWEREKPK